MFPDGQVSPCIPTRSHVKIRSTENCPAPQDVDSRCSASTKAERLGFKDPTGQIKFGATGQLHVGRYLLYVIFDEELNWADVGCRWAATC